MKNKVPQISFIKFRDILMIMLFSFLFHGAAYSTEVTTPQTFNISDDAIYSKYDTVIHRYLRSKSPRRNTTACVIGLSTGDDRLAWVIWRKGGKLILWEGEDDLNSSRRKIDLRKDVVPTDADIGSSTYLVSASWVSWLERTCSTYGRQVVANRHSKRG